MSFESGPILHLPPYFEKEVGDEGLAIKQWFGAAFVELSDGTFVRPDFIAITRVEFEVSRSGYYSDKDVVILAEVSLAEIRRVLPHLEQAGVFRAMTRYASIEW